MKKSFISKMGNLKKGFFALAGIMLAAGLARCQPADNNIFVNTLDGATIGVHFDQPMTDISVLDPANYTVFSKGGSGPTFVTDVVLQDDGQSVSLFVQPPVGEFFAVAVSNVFTSLLNSNINTSTTGYMSSFANTNIGTVADPIPPGQVFTALSDTFTVTASGSDIGGTNDHCQFVYQPIIGDFDMAVQVTRLDNTNPNSKAGLMARESLDPASAMLLVNLTPAAGTNQIQTSGRFFSGAQAVDISSKSGANAFTWLRMTRIGGALTTYFGTNGVDWIVSGSMPVSLNASLYIGMAVTSHANGQTTTATFTDFGFNGQQPGDSLLPAVSAAIFQKTNLVVKWQRTPRDFAVQVATGMTGTNQWSFLAIPIQDSNLTGTNAAMPTLGRYMIIPMNLFSNASLFVRLARVARVIPDPLNVTPGIILSQANGNLTTGSSSSICSLAVDSTTALASGVALLCPVGKTYQFTTGPSGSTLQTAIQLYKYPSLAAGGCDGAFSAGNYKSQVTVTPASPNLGYTFVVAATKAVKPTSTCPLKVQVNIY